MLIMAFWSKKKKKEPSEPVKIPECDHKWKDFKWYLVMEEDGFGRADIHIIEPYVCIHCKKRKDVKLQSWYNVSHPKKLCETITSNLGDKIEVRAIIEDEINDMTLVDREYLKWADYVAGRANTPKIELTI